MKMSLRLLKKFSSECKNQALISRLTKCHMSSRKACKPNDPCKSSKCTASKPCETKTPQTPRACDPSDHCRPPNLCSGELKKSEKICQSSDWRKQTVPCGLSRAKSSSTPKHPQQAGYPDKPWPTFGRPTTWSPTIYVPKSRLSDSCSPKNGSKPMCYKPDKTSSPDPCASCGDACKSQDSPSDPCGTPDPCKSTAAASSPCGPPPPCSTCPTCPPNLNPNLWTQEICRKTSARQPCPCDEMPVVCEDPEIGRSEKFFRTISLFGCLPVILLAAGIVLAREKEERSHPRPEYVPYAYMYIRSKRFPWGDGNHSFFHNPEKNAIPPDGYEVDDPNAIVVSEADETAEEPQEEPAEEE